MERLAQTNRTRGMSASALRMSGYFCLLMGIAGKGLIQNGMLGLTGLNTQEMLGVLEQSSEAMTLATVSIVLQALETCAVPIFAFLLVEGFQKTSSYQHYLTRMILVALASEIPYNLAFGGRLFVMDSRNPVFAMVLCLLMLYFFRYFSARSVRNTAIKAVVTVSALLWSGMLGIEHGAFLVLITAVFWLMRSKPGFQLLAGCGAAGIATLFSLFNLTAPFSCLLLYLYNGEKGDSNRVFNLICYPLMLLIAGIAAIYL